MPRPFRRSRTAILASILLALPGCTWMRSWFDDSPFEPSDDVTAQHAPMRTRCAWCSGTGKRAHPDGTPETGWFAAKCPECRGTGWR